MVAAYEVATSQQRRELRRRFSRREPGGERALRALLDELGGPSLTAGVPLVLARDAVAAIDPYDISHEALHDFAEVAVHVAERDH